MRLKQGKKSRKATANSRPAPKMERGNSAKNSKSPNTEKEDKPEKKKKVEKLGTKGRRKGFSRSVVGYGIAVRMSQWMTTSPCQKRSVERDKKS